MAPLAERAMHSLRLSKPPKPGIPGTTSPGRTFFSDQRCSEQRRWTNRGLPIRLRFRLHVVLARRKNGGPDAGTDRGGQEEHPPQNVSSTAGGSRRQSCRVVKNHKETSRFRRRR